MKHQITYALDVQTKTSVYERTVTQNDTIEFIITMLMGGEKMDLTGVTPSLAVKRLDGTVTVLNGTVDGNIITFNLGSSETAKPGRTQAVVQLYDANGRVSSLPFSFCVSADFTAAGFTPSENERTLIEVVLQDGPGILDRAERVVVQNETHFKGVFATVAERDAAVTSPTHGDTATVADETTGISTTYRYVDAAVDTTETESGWKERDRWKNATAINNLNQQLADTDAELENRLKAKQVVTNAQTDGVNITTGHPTNAIASDISLGYVGGGSSGYNNVIGGDGSQTVNKTTPNVPITGTGAHVSYVEGYDNVAGSLSSKIISDHSYTEIGGAGHNAIFGGASHVIRSTASFSFIAGGQQNDVSGRAAFATGYNNKVGGYGSAAFGYNHVLTKDGGFAIGAQHTINGLYATTTGSTNTAEGNFSKAEGNFAHTRTVGQQTVAGGRFSATGDAQTSVIPMYTTTTDATAKNIGVTGSTVSHIMLPKQTAAFHILVVARDANGIDSAAWEIKGLAYRGETGGSVIVGTPTITKIGETAGASAWTVAMFGSSSGTLNVNAKGEVGKTIRWMQRMTLVEVSAA